MENKRKDMIEDNEIDHLLQQLYGFSDEQLLRDFKEMEADNTPRPELEPFPDEFDRIWEDIQAEVEEVGSRGAGGLFFDVGILFCGGGEEVVFLSGEKYNR